MFQNNSRQYPVTTIVSECPPPQQVSIAYYNSYESKHHASHSVKPYYRSSQVRKHPARRSPPLRLAFTTSQPIGQNMANREESAGSENEYTKVFIRSSWKAPTTMTEGSISEEYAVRQLVERPRRRRNDDLTGRIFRSLMSRQIMFDNDDIEIENLLLAADKIIFNGRLSRRVRWRWSHLGEPGYDCELLGTTALLNAHPSIGGYETLIVLSWPLLKNKHYSRDLLLSAFLHELIHCYFFIQCGLGHAKDGGHTDGFRTIAKLIDKWFGQRLHLCNMRANLDFFRVYNTGPKVEEQRDSCWSERHESLCGSPGSPGSPLEHTILETRYVHRP